MFHSAAGNRLISSAHTLVAAPELLRSDLQVTDAYTAHRESSQLQELKLHFTLLQEVVGLIPNRGKLRLTLNAAWAVMVVCKMRRMKQNCRFSCLLACSELN